MEVAGASKRKFRIGVMQGRLSPRPEGKLQAFPWHSYAAEFESARRVGFDAIEWIFEADRFEQNPLWSSSGRAKIRELSAASGVAVQSVCGDYFMVHKLAGEEASALERNRRVLADLIAAAREVGADRILLPLLETSAVGTPELRREVVESLRLLAPVAERAGVTLGLEMEIAGEDYAALIRDVGSASVRAYYDTGNSTAQGFDIARDVEPLLPLLHAVHVKDRLVAGGSRPLGTGAANFAEFFPRIVHAGFRGDFLLQHYFELEPEAEARQSLEFVRSSLARAGAS